ncbi:MAG: CocE/NonD family hydrolase [Nitrososphaerota archaeon]|nr:CocE/NonD family hydrolase [Nitrososphaerota archaeon]
MVIERDVGITMDDGIVLRADIFRPKSNEKVPVIMNLGPYNKGLRYQEGYAPEWKRLVEEHPEVMQGSTCSFLTWETVDPERWVPNGYAVARIDARGTGRSPGIVDKYSPREIRDFYTAIEWSATQSWCNGKVGLLGISYYAITQWLVASLQPPHLTAIIPWEGACDHYREMTYHGGILCNGFVEQWYARRFLPRQHGKGMNSAMDPWLGKPATGDETLSEEQLKQNRTNYLGDIRRHKLDDEFHRSRSADLSKIKIPLMSASNWGGIGLHSRGNFEGFMRSASEEKWLSVHVGRHEEYFYLKYGLDLQMRFFDHFLKGKSNGWEKEPRVLLTIRHVDRFEERKESEWPIARTKWTMTYLNSHNGLQWETPSSVDKFSFNAQGSGVTLYSNPLEKETEITGPVVGKLNIASSTTDADLFLTLRAFSPEDREVTFHGANEPKAPLSQGWLRASHRKKDPHLSRPYRPYHTHDEVQKLEPEKVYEVEVEMWPTCIVLPSGYRIALTIGGGDFERPDSAERFKGSGPFIHNDAGDRGSPEFHGVTKIQTGGANASHLLLPVVPPA